MNGNRMCAFALLTASMIYSASALAAHFDGNWSMGEPGWPEFAAWMASIHSVRRVLIACFSIPTRSPTTVRPVLMRHLRLRPAHLQRCYP